MYELSMSLRPWFDPNASLRLTDFTPVIISFLTIVNFPYLSLNPKYSTESGFIRVPNHLQTEKVILSIHLIQTLSSDTVSLA